MKTTILCILYFATAWALPNSQDELQYKRLYIDPSADGLPADLVPRITNGNEAVPHSIPYQAYLIFTSQSLQRWLCGGSLISSTHVLTAGHCVDDGVSALVYLGAHNIKETESTQLVVHSNHFILHEDYDIGTISNDIGIIILNEEVVFNEYINIVALPSSQLSTDYEGVNARVSGWGRISGEGSTSPVLLEVNSTVISNTICDRIYNIVIDSQICIAGTGGVGSCNGDSGGPLVAGDHLIGVVSYGAKGCPAGYPSVFSRVTSYLDWISNATGLSF